MAAATLVVPVTLEIGDFHVENISQAGDGNLAPLACPLCGMLLVVLPFLVQTITIRNATGSCPQCGLNSPILDGTYGFSRYVQETLSRTNITLEQAASALAAITTAKTDVELVSRLAHIDASLASLAEIAIQKPDRRRLLKWLGRSLLGIGAVESGLAIYDWVEDRVVSEPQEQGLDAKESKSHPHEDAGNDQGHRPSEDTEDLPQNALPIVRDT